MIRRKKRKTTTRRKEPEPSTSKQKQSSKTDEPVALESFATLQSCFPDLSLTFLQVIICQPDEESFNNSSLRTKLGTLDLTRRSWQDSSMKLWRTGPVFHPERIM